MATRSQWAKRPGRSSKWISKRRRLALYLRDGFACQYCGLALADLPNRAFGLDHLAPRCKGGLHADSNLVTACARCNYSRQDKVWWKYATGGAVARIRQVRHRTVNLGLAGALLRGNASWADAVQAGGAACSA